MKLFGMFIAIVISFAGAIIMGGMIRTDGYQYEFLAEYLPAVHDFIIPFKILDTVPKFIFGVFIIFSFMISWLSAIVFFLMEE